MTMTMTMTPSSMTTKNKPYTGRRWRPPVKTHGGKYYLARLLAGLVPTDITVMCEAYVGGGSFFLNLHPNLYQSAILNDLDAPTNALWKVLCQADTFPEFLQIIRGLTYSQEVFETYRDMPRPLDNLGMAVQHFVVSRMSRGGMGKAFAWSERLRGGIPGDLNAWKTVVADLPEFHERLHIRPLSIGCVDASDLIKIIGQHSSGFIYADPPYYHPARKSKKVYRSEMSCADHRTLLARCLRAKCRIMLSGYHNVLYDKVFQRWSHRGWRAVEIDMANHAGKTDIKERRTEVVWMNYNEKGVVTA